MCSRVRRSTRRNRLHDGNCFKNCYALQAQARTHNNFVNDGKQQQQKHNVRKTHALCAKSRPQGQYRCDGLFCPQSTIWLNQFHQIVYAIVFDRYLGSAVGRMTAMEGEARMPTVFLGTRNDTDDFFCCDSNNTHRIWYRRLSCFPVSVLCCICISKHCRTKMHSDRLQHYYTKICRHTRITEMIKKQMVC